ncbi:MAG: cell division protein ZapA [Elusimicrobiaceae bacterium]|nr:cell division protein ZapA [Elusimicrobiaceae bacterium]
MSEQINVEINKISISGVILPGIEALEAQIYARDVTARMKKLEEDTNIYDTLRIAMLTAMVLAAELAKTKEELERSSQANLVKMDKMIKSLSDTLNEKKPGAK